MVEAYYDFVVRMLLVFFPFYVVMKWKSYYAEKDREKTLRQAMKTGGSE